MSGRNAPDWLTRWEYAHRGLHRSGVPENSLRGAADAIAAGMGVECDIQMSREGVPMVFHDWTLDRLTGQGGAVADLRCDELAKLRLLDSDQVIAPLSALLELVAGRVPVLIEIKSKPDFHPAPACAAVGNCLADYVGDNAVMSFDPRIVTWFAAHEPARARGLVGTDSFKNGFQSMWRDPDVLKEADPDFLAVDVRDLARPEAMRWRLSGRALLTWTVGTAEARRRALSFADALISEAEGLV